MKHLFIINPICAKIKGRFDAIVQEINDFMKKYAQFNYDIHVTRWSRDAIGYCRRYVLNAGDEIVRVHTLGGTGTTFEIINAVVDLPNAQVALYPMGRTNIFLHYFGLDKKSLFASIENQVISDTIKIDAIRCNHNYGISNILIGFEAYVDNKGDKMIEKTRLPNDLCYALVALPHLLKRTATQYYKMSMDNQTFDGDYISIMIANQPWYGDNMCPAIDARPDDGVLDIYRLKESNRIKRTIVAPSYLSGKYRKYPDLLIHQTGQVIKVSSEKLMWLSVDGETFYGNNIECEIVPEAIAFVCPDSTYTNGGRKS